MGCRIILGHEEGSKRDVCVLFCSTMGLAFGPLIYDFESVHYWLSAHGVAEHFLKWLPEDARTYQSDELTSRYAAFLCKLPVILKAELEEDAREDSDD